jgi:hypothetical protein
VILKDLQRTLEISVGKVSCLTSMLGKRLDTAR